MIKDLTDSELVEFLRLCQIPYAEQTLEQRERKASLHAQAILFVNVCGVRNLIAAQRKINTLLQ